MKLKLWKTPDGVLILAGFATMVSPFLLLGWPLALNVLMIIAVMFALSAIRSWLLAAVVMALPAATTCLLWAPNERWQFWGWLSQIVLVQFAGAAVFAIELQESHKGRYLVYPDDLKFPFLASALQFAPLVWFVPSTTPWVLGAYGIGLTAIVANQNARDAMVHGWGRTWVFAIAMVALVCLTIFVPQPGQVLLPALGAFGTYVLFDELPGRRIKEAMREEVLRADVLVY